jgi:hypothetical protein
MLSNNPHCSPLSANSPCDRAKMGNLELMASMKRFEVTDDDGGSTSPR